MSLTELAMVVGLWAIWLLVLLVLLHGIGRNERAPRGRRPRLF